MKNNIKRPALRYYGGKWRMADFIISHFPSHKVYLEPCFGAGSILLKKRRSKVETVNDLDDLITNFFEVLRDQSEKLLHCLKLTPWSRKEIEKQPADTKCKIEKARRTFLQHWATIGQANSSSFRVSKSSSSQPASIMNQLDYLYEVAGRLRGVQIENLDALDFIQRYAVKNALIYFDPPYVQTTRSHKKAYNLEVNDEFHVHASDLLKANPNCFCVISGYRSNLYDYLYEGWKRVDFKVLANSGQKKVESLWLNEKAEEAIYSLDLFGQGEFKRNV